MRCVDRRPPIWGRANLARALSAGGFVEVGGFGEFVLSAGSRPEGMLKFIETAGKIDGHGGQIGQKSIKMRPGGLQAASRGAVRLPGR